MEQLPSLIAASPLLTTFAERLNQVLDQRPDLCRKGRGRIGDFAEHFHLHYTTAHRVLSGGSFPTPELLLEIRRTFAVSLDWLLGAGSDGPSDDGLTTPVRVPVFDPRSQQPESLWLQASLLPPHLLGQSLVAAVVNLHPLDGPARELALVAVMQQVVDGAVHVVYDPARGRNLRMRLSMSLSHRQVTATALHSGTTEQLEVQQLQFGLTHEAVLPSVIGPVVGHLNFQPGVMSPLAFSEGMA